MRKATLAALLLTTALVPAPAEAAPVVAFVQSAITAISAATGIGAGVVGTFLARTAVAIGLSAIQRALAPKPRSPAPSERMVNYAQPVVPMRRIYGDVRIGGPFAYSAMKDKTRFYGVLIAAHSTVGPLVHFLDTREVTLDGNGDVVTDPINGAVSISTYSGQPGQAVDPDLAANFTEFTPAHDMAGLSWAAIRARRVAESKFTTVYPSGREPAYAPVWRGDDQIFDPRTGQRGYSNNAALVLARHAEVSGKSVNWDAVALEAAACDVMIPNGDGGTQRRWTLNIAFDDDVTWGQALADLSLACDAFVFERPDGALGFVVGRWVEPTVTLEDADFLSIAWSGANWGPDVTGSFACTYVEPARDWFEATSGAIVLADGPRETVEAFACNSHNQAARIARSVARRARPSMRVQGTIKLAGFQCVGHRFLRIRLTRAASFDHVIEVEELTMNSDGQTWSLSGYVTTEADFADASASYEPARPSYASVGNADDVPAATGLTAEVVAGAGGVAQIALDWTAPDVSLTPVLRVRQNGSDWQEIETGAGAGSWLLTGLADGAVYEFQIRNRTAARRTSDWAPITPVAVTAVANTVAPLALAAAAVTALGSNADASWTAPNDAVFAAVRIWRGPTTDFDDAVAVHVEFGAPNMTDSWTDAGLAAGTYSYWLEPLNASGVAGPRSGPITITIL